MLSSFSLHDTRLVLRPTLRYNFVSFSTFTSFIYSIVHRCGAGGTMRACHTAGPNSIPGREKFPGWVFSGFFLTCKTCQEALRPQSPRISFGHHYYPFIFALLEWMDAWMVYIVFHVRVVSEVAPALSSSLIRGGTPCPGAVKKYECDRVNSLSRQVVAL